MCVVVSNCALAAIVSSSGWNAPVKLLRWPTIVSYFVGFSAVTLNNRSEEANGGKIIAFSSKTMDVLHTHIYICIYGSCRM